MNPKAELIKLAAETLLALNAELERYKAQKRKDDMIFKIAESFLSEDFFKKVAEFKDKDEEELKIIEKAIELNKQSGFNIGTAVDTSEQDNRNDMDPLTRYLKYGDEEIF